jgi:hypothetical protein
MSEIGAMPAGQVVDYAHGEPTVEQMIDHVTADKAGAAGDDGNVPGAHAALSIFKRRTLK